MREFYDRTGHDIKDMLLSCYYRGVECSAEDFKVVSGDVPAVKRPPHGRRVVAKQGRRLRRGLFERGGHVTRRIAGVFSEEVNLLI